MADDILRACGLVERVQYRKNRALDLPSREAKRAESLLRELEYIDQRNRRKTAPA